MTRPSSRIGLPFVIAAAALLLASAGPALAQSSASYAIQSEAFNAGANPSPVLSSASYSITLDSIGDTVAASSLSSASYTSGAASSPATHRPWRSQAIISRTRTRWCGFPTRPQGPTTSTRVPRGISPRLRGVPLLRPRERAVRSEPRRPALAGPMLLLPHHRPKPDHRGRHEGLPIFRHRAGEHKPLSVGRTPMCQRWHWMAGFGSGSLAVSERETSEKPDSTPDHRRNAPPIKILIVDDHPVVREGLRAILETEAGISVAGQAATGEDALLRFGELRPDVILLDVHLADESGLDVLCDIRTQDEGAMVLMMSVFDHGEDIRRAHELGAMGYLLKDLGAEEIVAAIRAVHKGKSALAARIGGKPTE